MKVIIVLAIFIVAVNAGAISIVKTIPAAHSIKISRPIAIVPLVPILNPKGSGHALPGAGLPLHGAGLPLHGAGLPVLGGGLTLKG